ncbi:MAG: MBL fold metallo-hydrolase [Candidatus Krumholzibacteriota bacterium]|nr:MBL fold metallo-hydrolase [Candidatus Krumholzibacteriota bacterium]
MKTGWYLLIIAIILAAGLNCSHYDVESTGLVRVSERVYAVVAEGPSALQGLGANSGFIVGDDAILVIDSRYTPDLAKELLQSIKAVSDLPVRFVVNTHYHPDHTWGNSVFAESGAIVISTPATRDAIEKYTPVYLEFYREQKPEVYDQLRGVKMHLPDSLVLKRTFIDLGGVSVEIYHPGPAHTAGDLIVYVESEKVVFTGGITSNHYHANMGDQGADFHGWMTVLDDLGKRGPRHVIPGQGKICGKDIFAKQKKYLNDFIGAGKTAIREEKALSQLAATVIPGTEDYLQENMIPFNMQAIYRKYMISTVDPDFRFDPGDDIIVREGGGNAARGRIQWVMQSEDGYSELEVSWKPVNRTEVIIEDIYDDLSRHLGENPDHHMSILGSKEIMIGNTEAVAAFGTWGYKIGTVVAAGGIWTWSMMIEGNILYSVKLSTNTESDHEKEKMNMEILEKAVSTFHFIR